MKRLILRILPWVARCHRRNWRKDRRAYPQLWYCMPSIYRDEKTGPIYCCVCGKRIKGHPAAGEGAPGMTSRYACEACGPASGTLMPPTSPA